mmetsp:Transcript_105278/g.263622  ORF Transcript_105278/g.263622 Transcript_105278/m.263622 type:complete len:90 (-) Transcript_105278:94-363(-)
MQNPGRGAGTRRANGELGLRRGWDYPFCRFWQQGVFYSCLPAGRSSACQMMKIQIGGCVATFHLAEEILITGSPMVPPLPRDVEVGDDA